MYPFQKLMYGECKLLSENIVLTHAYIHIYFCPYISEKSGMF